MKVNMNDSLSRVGRIVLGLVALLCFTSPAWAEGNVLNLGSNNVWTVYAFGNAQAVSDSFRALTNFTASSTFKALVSMVGVLGVLAVGGSGGFNPAMGKRLIGYFVGVLLVSYMLFGIGNDGPLVVNVEVIDTVDNTWKSPATIPAVVGIPAAIISSAGFEITKTIEASFVIPEALKMSNGAPFNLAAAMIADAGKARITDPNLASSLAYYVQDCFTIGVARNQLQASSLIWSTKFLDDIKFDSNTVLVNTLLSDPVGEPDIVTCSKAWTLINTAITSQGSEASAFLKDASAWSKTPALSVVNSAADSVAQWASNNGVTDGASLVKQSAVISAFRTAHSQAAVQTGNSEFLTGIAMTQAVESQRTSWIVGAEIFNKTMGYIFAIIQVFVYAIIPLVLCAALIPSLGLALLKNFSQILLWLAIWQPMLAIVNFVILSMQQADIGGVLSNGSTYGFTLSNIGIVTEKTANLRAAASFVGTMVPALAWALVKGSVDFSRVIGSAVGENFAQGAANTMTTGNYSLNQASMDSFTANKHSTASSNAFGYGLSNSSATATMEHNQGGSMLPTRADQRVGYGVQKTQSTNDAGSVGNAVNAGLTGSNMNSAADSTSITTNGGTNENGSTSETSNNNSSVTAGASVSGSTPIVAGSKGGAPSSSGGPANGQGNGNTTTDASTPAQRQANLATRMVEGANLTLQANSGVGIGGQQAHADQYAKGATTSITGANSRSANTTVSGGTTGNLSKSANDNSGYSSQSSETITGFASPQTRADLMAHYARPENSMTGGDWAFPTDNTRAGNEATKLEKPEGINQEAMTKQQEVVAAEAKLGNQVKGLAGAPAARMPAIKTEADDAIKKGKTELKHANDASKKGAAHQLVNRAEKVAGDVVDSAAAAYGAGKDMFNKAKEGVEHAMAGAKPTTQEPTSAHPQTRAEQRAAYEQRQHQPAPVTTPFGQQHQQSPDTQSASHAPAASHAPTAQQPTHGAPVAQNAQHDSAHAFNPFSGERSEPGGAAQNQVQLAEQRADRVGNQLRSVDGVLASADGRNASELPELINQARDFTRKA